MILSFEYIRSFLFWLNISIMQFLMIQPHTVQTVIYQRDLIKDKLASRFNRTQNFSLWLPIYIFNFLTILYLGNLMCLFIYACIKCVWIRALYHQTIFDSSWAWYMILYILCVFLMYKDNPCNNFWISKWMFREHFLRNHGD